MAEGVGFALQAPVWANPRRLAADPTGRLAEGVGFEPTRACTLTVFKTVAFNRSATPPRYDFSRVLLILVSMCPPFAHLFAGEMGQFAPKSVCPLASDLVYTFLSANRSTNRTCSGFSGPERAS